MRRALSQNTSSSSAIALAKEAMAAASVASVSCSLSLNSASTSASLPPAFNGLRSLPLRASNEFLAVALSSDGVSRERRAAGAKLRRNAAVKVVATGVSTTVNGGANTTTSKTVLVVGATGGVGQLVVASLLEKGVRVRALLRSAEKARALFGDEGDHFQFRIADCRQPEELDASVVEGVTHVICCTGTTAFPSKRWDGNNGPEQTDWLAVRNLVDALPSTVQKFVLVSSVGVTKSEQLPWSIMNLFGVLKYKKLGEDHLRSSGKTFTIIRPGRLTDGPYTSYDLNTLLKATAGTRRDVIIGQGDKLVGEASRLVVAEACVKALDLDCTNGQTYEISSVEGEGPGKDLEKWAELFVSAHSTS